MVNIRFVHVLSHFCLVYFTMVSSSHSALFSTFSSQLNLYQVLLIFAPLFSSTLDYYNSLQSQSSYFSSSIAPPLFLILILVFAFLQSTGVVNWSWKCPVVARPLHLMSYIGDGVVDEAGDGEVDENGSGADERDLAEGDGANNVKCDCS